MEEFNIVNLFNIESGLMEFINYYTSSGLISSEYEMQCSQRLRKASCPDEENKYLKSTNRSEERDVDKIIQVIKTENYKYVGETICNNREGFGVCYFTNGEVFIGQWRNDKREGYGKTILANGDINQGEMRDNLYEGFCETISIKKSICAQGYAIKGKFVDEIIIKKGDYIIESIIPFTIFKILTSNHNNKFYGDNTYGVYVDENSIISGQISNMKINGYGEIYFKDGLKIIGYFKDNKKNGICFIYTKDGALVYGNYQDNVKNGAFITINKSNYKVELYHYGFRTKIIEKIETSKKYLSLNYPELTYILKIDYKKIIEKFTIEDDLQKEFINI